MKVNPNYTEVNAAAALEESDSIFSYYQKLIAIRKSKEMLVTGAFEVIWEENPHIFAYLRSCEAETLLIICNFTEKEVSLDEKKIPYLLEDASIVITNRKDCLSERHKIEPYEATVYEWKDK